MLRLKFHESLPYILVGISCKEGRRGLCVGCNAVSENMTKIGEKGRVTKSIHYPAWQESMAWKLRHGGWHEIRRLVFQIGVRS